MIVQNTYAVSLILFYGLYIFFLSVKNIENERMYLYIKKLILEDILEA